jgi:glycolate oxidase
LSGEHGIGVEKRDLMPEVFSADDLDAQARVREAFDPEGALNPGKVLPAGSRIVAGSGR